MITWKNSSLILTWWIISILLGHAQIDLQLCPQRAITVRDPKWPNISPSFELFAELTDNSGTAEIIQTLTNQRDLVIQTANGETISEYWYFDTNEQFEILHLITDGQTSPACLRQVIGPLATTSTIRLTPFIKPSVLLGYNARDEINLNFGTKFIRASQLSFMPVNIFESCFYLNDLRITVAVTYHMTDIEKFPSFGYMNDSVPLRIEVRTKSTLADNEETYFYNIFRFLSNLTAEQQQQALSIPAGIFCLNQTNTKPAPSNLSDKISMNGEIQILSGEEFAIESVDTIYDRPFQFAQFKVWSNNSAQTIELHDFATGLIYRYFTSTQQCNVWRINSSMSDALPIPNQSHFFQMAQPLHLFLLDDMNFQYTGSRECHRQMRCHVWIGEKPLSSGTGFERREWYWAYEFNNRTIEPWIPVRLVRMHLNAQQKPVILTEMNGGSAVQLTNGTYHIRLLSEFIQFSSSNTQQPIVPKYIGSGFFRDMPVDQWEVCIVDKQIKRTERRVWSFVKPDFQTSADSKVNISIPLGYVMNASIVPNDGSMNLEFNEIISIVSFKPKIVDTSDFFALPQGTFCPNMMPNLVSLSDSGIEWPLRYTVRVVTTTSRGVRTNPLRLRVDNNADTRRARFDYMIDDENNYETLIIDYREQIKYVIDQTRGVCKILQGVSWPDVNPELNPIEFFLKLKETMLDQPPTNTWQYKGTRLCRGSTMHCVIYTMSLDNYPPMISPETGMPSAQNWDETHIEYAWSKRDLILTPQIDKPKILDYPVSLFLRTYQRIATSTGTEYRSEEIEYEFFEMSTDLPNDGFDISVCYRSRNWPYLHLAFMVKLSKGNLADSNHLNRKELYDRFLLMLQTTMAPISSTRIHQLEIDHDITLTADTLYVMFLLLGPTPAADPISGNISLTTPIPTDQLSVEAAREQLRSTINNGNFNINVQLLDSDRSNVTFMAVPDSLQNAKEFLAAHPLIFNGENTTVSEINMINMTNTIVHTVVVSEEKTEWKWSSRAQVGGIVGGLLIGLVVGIVVILIANLVMKKPSSPSQTTLPMLPITSTGHGNKQEILISNPTFGATQPNLISSNA
ncbi:unnamed protein product [Rotaria sp. Silwood2]|nr:unnamed protein product [Rotaria sp. Silwood2]